MSYKVLNSIWWTPPVSDIMTDLILSPSQHLCIGAVAIETHGDKWKAYIGYGYGDDEETDEQRIAVNGAKVTKEQAVGMFPQLEAERFTY